MDEINTKAVIADADQVGGIVLPALISVGYAGYLFLSVGINTTNGWILLVLGIGTLMVSGWGRRPSSLIPAYLLGCYLFFVIGLLGLGLAISEKAAWDVLGLAILWTLLGWRCLAKTSEKRRALSASN